jgi:hypothetical protein
MITQGIGSPRTIGGQTAKQLTQAFVTVKTAGVREMAEKLRKLGEQMGEPKALENACKLAAKHIERGYKAKIGNVTGNLRKSVTIRTKLYDAAAVAIVGPRQTGTGASKEGRESGNHAWLVEFGTGVRKPGTRGRRTYLNVHQLINGKMRRHSSANNTQFANMSKGYYFLMGSKYEPTRQARAGSGGDHDFWTPESGGPQRPVTLHPGETYGAMPASHAMRDTIAEQQGAVFGSLVAAIQNSLDRLTR